MTEGTPPAHTNRLIQATSPYLLQHAHNPVDWYPWGEEALARARAEDKPILLSIGYSACHWCHVMERESFEDEAIAALMNECFVCIKVDREERPDLDDVYMDATLAMNQGHGGWPMTVFLTPEQEPFFAGTYFPPEDRWGRPGFATLLTRLAGLWRDDRTRLRGQAAELVVYLRQNAATAPGSSLGEEELRSALAAYARDFDARFGGFGDAPKFPPSTALRLLLRLHRRFGDEHALEMVRKTLDEMARGGMYDQLGGGFHRYSVDERWLAPHFEKMLYDNALLARAYLEGWQATGDPFYARVAREVLDYVLREMTDPAGGFHSATDADSEGEEGRFFVWTPEQVEAVLGAEDARVFCAYYDIEERGNWEGKSIPNTSRTGPAVARSLGLTPEALEAVVAGLKPRLYEARRQRVPPGLDDKVLTAWNGLMISALAEGHRVLGDRRYLQAAERAAGFLLTALRGPEGRLLRTWRAGRAHTPAFLEDHAYLADALLDLYEAGGATRFLHEAETLLAVLRRDFGDEAGGFFGTPADHEALIVRPREGHDGATPNANAVAAHALARLSYHLDRPALREQAVSALRAWGRALARQPRAFAHGLLTVDLLLDGPTELAFAGPAGDEGLEALRREVARHFVPNRIVAHHDPGQVESDLPLLRGKGLVHGRAALYVCRDFTCASPVTEAEQVAAALSGPLPPAASRPALARPELPGHATAEGTAAYAARHAQGGHRPFGNTGLTASLLGFGGYRVDEQTPEHRAALRQALSEGVNVVDTSTNYTDGGSERLVGEVLAELAGRGELRRQEVVVVSKIGYLQGHNLELAEQREARGHPFPDVVKYGPGIWHCVHPEFLEDQLARSLERLGLLTLDVLLLHNPEYFLKDGHERSHGSLEKRREEFARRLGEAFAWLELQVAERRIRFYGVSSNTCTAPADDPEATSLTSILELAAAAGGPGHHFRVLQLPLNLFESGAVHERNNGADLQQTVLDRAAASGLAVLVNRPLNAFVNESLVRLADVAVPEEGPAFEAQAAAVEALEDEFRSEIAAHLQTSEGSLTPDHFFRWGAELQGTVPHVRGLEHWEALESQRIVPRLVQVLQALDGGLQGEMAERWREWRGRYVPELQRLLAAARREAARQSQVAARGTAERLGALLPEARRAESLSRKALWVAASTPGVTTVLVGMRSPAYVSDALAVLAWPPLPNARAAYDRVTTPSS